LGRQCVAMCCDVITANMHLQVNKQAHAFFKLIFVYSNANLEAVSWGLILVIGLLIDLPDAFKSNLANKRVKVGRK
jgi:hypothetical protein